MDESTNKRIRKGFTHRLNRGTDLLRMTDNPFGIQDDLDIKGGYIRLPVGSEAITTIWRVIFELAGPEHFGLLPLEIVSDVVIGRGYMGENAPELDLDALDAFQLGVSRRHALLRPSPNHLYLIDLGSSNGTLVNGYPLGTGIAQSLAEQTHISLGKLNMSILLLQPIPCKESLPGCPEDRPLPPGSDAAEADLPGTDKLENR
ncbi:MAG: FHA domain-containing protein [Anaerolineae bacterium]|nr:FHA domain-containing protein [Anaerolineae bacterium]